MWEEVVRRPDLPGRKARGPPRAHCQSSWKCPPDWSCTESHLTCSKTGKKESCSLTCASKAHYPAESDNSYSVSCGIPIPQRSPRQAQPSSSQSCIGRRTGDLTLDQGDSPCSNWPRPFVNPECDLQES
ncbi:signal peptide, CUB and EGF-like domain-containing protein 3 isoform X2 [Lates japonicus]|uniref:Signal peptide, CUB and EGF-like domain-containing protein 3 isoform X2 n=1 Tax=Lates japonicus TaxID=270547 RepID=A0AAD3R070_LATJO|nr:signal peptide, CUB and EGF-like domain-containing protein 3 isoform X2 [Lates japonicus]